MSRKIFLSFGLCLFIFFVKAQKSHFGDYVRTIQINSEVLSEEREILVYSPNFVSGDKLKLPTIYLFDGSENMLLIRGIVSNLVRADVIPEVNIVGINNYDYDRVHDLTPPLKGDSINEEFGGGDDFLQFIQTEVFPAVSGQFPESNFKVLIGHSLGGLIGTYIAVNKPDLFDAYLNIGSSYWYDNEAAVDELADILASGSHKLKGKKLYFSIANETDSRNGYGRVERLMASAEFDTKFEVFDEADHVTALTPAIFNGLQFVFREWAVWDQLYANIDFEQIRTKGAELTALFDMDVKPRAVELASYARGFTGKGEYAKAIQILNYLEPFYPEHIMVLNYLGEALEKNGELSKAKIIYNRSLEVAERKKSPMVRWIKRRLSEIDN